jgi:hypothetical protein
MTIYASTLSTLVNESQQSIVKCNNQSRILKQISLKINNFANGLSVRGVGLVKKTV